MTATPAASPVGAIRRLMDLLWTPEPFRAWLARQRRPGTPVGQANHCKRCPIAVFLHDEGYRNPFVATDQLGVWDPRSSGRVVIDTPSWAARFVGAVDTAHESMTLTVTRDAAITVLDSVTGG